MKVCVLGDSIRKDVYCVKTNLSNRHVCFYDRVGVVVFADYCAKVCIVEIGGKNYSSLPIDTNAAFKVTGEKLVLFTRKKD